MSTTSSVTGTDSTTATDTTRRLLERTPKSTLDKDDFLKLLVTQLKYQNPMEPSDNNEFIGQMASFSSLEQLQQINASITGSYDAGMANYANSLIGKYIYASSDLSGGMLEKDIEGEKVDAMYMSGGMIFLVVGDKELPLSAVVEVVDSSLVEGAADKLAQGSSLIGKYVQAQINKEGDLVNGLVTKLTVKNGRVYAVVNDNETLKEVLLDLIQQVSPDPIPVEEKKDPEDEKKNPEDVTGGGGGNDPGDEDPDVSTL